MTKDIRIKMGQLFILISILLICSSCRDIPETTVAFDFETPKNVILISIDTLRADRIGAYGYDKPISPNIDQFAKDSVIFEHAYTSSNWTLPGHAGMFTGLMSSAHRAITHRDSISPDVSLITELMQKSGMSTGAFVSHIFVSEKYGFRRGFDHFSFDELTSAKNISDQAIAWINDLSGQKRFFAFLHFFDVHLPYGRDKSFNERFAPDCPFPAQWAKTVETALAEDWVKFQCFQKLYDADIAYVDEHIGRFFEFLKQKKLYDDTLIILTSDHGELFGEHGGAGHGLTLFEEEIAVPLIMKLPKQKTGGSSISPQVSNIQIAPTIIDALGLKGIQADLPSLLPKAERDNSYPKWVAAESRKTGPDQIAIIQGRKKAVLPPAYGIQGRQLSPAYFDLDQGEDVDLWMKKPTEAKNLVAMATNSGWYGKALCYEISFAPETLRDSLTLEFQIANGIKPKTISTTNKVFAKDGIKFRAHDVQVSERGDVKIVTLNAEEHRRGFTMVIDPPNTPVTFRITSKNSKNKLPVLLGSADKILKEESITLSGPTGDLRLPENLPAHYLMIRSYEVLHLERPDSAPSAKAKALSKQQVEMLRSLGYVGM